VVATLGPRPMVAAPPELDMVGVEEVVTLGPLPTVPPGRLVATLAQEVAATRVPPLMVAPGQAMAAVEVVAMVGPPATATVQWLHQPKTLLQPRPPRLLLPRLTAPCQGSPTRTEECLTSEEDSFAEVGQVIGCSTISIYFLTPDMASKNDVRHNIE